MEDEPPQQDPQPVTQPTTTSLHNPSSVYPDATHSGYDTQPASQLQKAETPNQPKHKYSVAKILLIVLIAILAFGSIDGIYLHLKPKLHQAQGAILGHGYTTHTLSVGGQTIHLSFDKSATSHMLDANETLFSGNDLTGHNIIVSLKTIPDNVAVSNSCDGLGGAPSATLGSVIILNKSYPLCGIAPNTSSPQNNSYIGVHFQSKTQWYRLEYSLPLNVNYYVDINTAKQIATSISVQ